MYKKNHTCKLAFLLLFCFLVAPVSYASQVVNLDASSLVARSEISITPAQATFTEGSIFEVPILINTKGRSVNTIELNLKFDPTKLSIVKPSTGKSIIGLWIQPPTYDNTKGTASIAGSIPGGIVSDSSLILSITFQAKSVGDAEVRVMDTSSVLANDGVGTQTVLTYNRAIYSILPKPPGGLTIYSDTHPFQDHWYNNNSPVLAWNKDPGIIGFSYVLDDKPNTIPDNKNLLDIPTKAYQDLSDGLWYFHVKALKDTGAWSSTTNYIMRIDTTAPAKFVPKVDYILNDKQNRALVSFFTTDSLSGIDHYEIGTIDNSQPGTASSIFVRTESPFEVPPVSVSGATVIVRAYDIAGNSLDTKINVSAPSKVSNYFKDHLNNILFILIFILLLLYLVHYLWGHKIIAKIRIIAKILDSKNSENIIKEETNEIKEEVKVITQVESNPNQASAMLSSINPVNLSSSVAPVAPVVSEVVEVPVPVLEKVKLNPDIAMAEYLKRLMKEGK